MFQIIALIAAFQALFFGVLVLTKKNKSMLDKHLSAWLLYLAVHILCISASQSENIIYSSYFVYPSYILAGLRFFPVSMYQVPDKQFFKRVQKGAYYNYRIYTNRHYRILFIQLISTRNGCCNQNICFLFQYLVYCSCYRTIPPI